MKAVRTSLIAAVALVLSAGALIARAHEAPVTASQLAVHRTSVARTGLSLDQAVRLAQHRYKARVVRAETQMQGGRTIYVLRMLDDAGRVFAVRVDAASGTIL
jgi:uncharacterized membrane protein YkoI